MPLKDAHGGFTVFISYAHEDNDSPEPGKQWLNRLLLHLQPLVFQKQVRTWSDRVIEPGERWHESIQEQLQNAKVAVLLVSPAFLASEYIRNSELPVLLKNAQDRGVTVLPIILRRCLFTATKFKYPDPVGGPEELTLATFQAANSPDKPLNAMRGHKQDEVLVSIAERILALAPQDPAGLAADDAAATAGGAPPGKAPADWNVPHPRNPFFTGRARDLDELHRALIATGKAALSGMGGVGKTQTAVEYAYRHRGEYGAVLWARADTEDSLKADFAAIAAKLDLPEKDEAERDKVVAAVKRWLEGHAGWLLILDNADDLTPVSGLLRRERGGHILLTTRAHATGGIGKVKITEMTSEEGTLFLLRRAKLIAIDDALAAATEADQKLAEEITREVGGLPLALDQAGAFIEEGPSSLTEYHGLYRSEGAKLRDERGGPIADHESVTITFSLAFRRVEASSAAAGDMLRACAFLAPDAIPEEIFVGGAEELGENLSPTASGGIALVKMIREAGRFSLIRRDTKGGTIEIHRLVQQVLKDEIGEAGRLWAERVVRGVNKAFPQVEHKNWPLCEKFLPHAQEAAKLIVEYAFEFEEAAQLLNQAGYYCRERAQYTEAEQLFVRALSIREKVLGPDHPDLALSLNNLATVYNDRGQYAEAEPLYARALSIREKVLGPDHPDLALSLNNLGLLYSMQGRSAEAEPLLARALNIFEKVLGPEHPNLAMSLNNLGLLYSMQGKYTEAELLFERALSIDEKALGPDHPDLALSLHNLGLLYSMQGKYAEAEPLLARALNILEKALGPEHSNTSIIRGNYMNLLRKI